MSRNQLKRNLTKTSPFAGSVAFGNTGCYERLSGKASFAIDPSEEGLPWMCDLEVAPRNAEGLVEFSADVGPTKQHRTRAVPEGVPGADGQVGQRDSDPAAFAGASKGRQHANAEEVLAKFPKVPGVLLPKGPSRLPYWSYGPDFDRGIISAFPPEAVPGNEYPMQVPQVDSDGNDIAGRRYPDVEAPVGTYCGWAVRKAGFAEGELLSTNGCFIPFARTREERETSGDPRPSIEERYPSHEAYVEAVRKAADARVKEGLMLEEDRDRFVEAAQRKNPLDPAVPLGALLPVGGGDQR